MKLNIAQNLPKSKIYILFLISITLAVTGKGLLSGDFWWSDESRHAMDGVYFLDLIKDMPISHLYQYTKQYYAKYPALGLAWYPPFFAMIEAVFYAILGISTFTARFTVIFFALLGISIWYIWIRNIYNYEVAFYSGLLFITTPLVVYWSHAVMLEIPTLTMIILCFYCFYNYFELDKKKYAYYLALSLSAALLTKQTAAFIIPLFFSYILIRKKYKKLIKKECIIAYIILAVFIIPLTIFTLKFGTLGLRVTLGNLKEAGKSGILEQWSYYLYLLPNIVTRPVLILAIISIPFLIKTKDKKSSLFLLWIFWWYICFSYIFGAQGASKWNYYGIYVVPPLCLLSVLILNSVKNMLNTKLTILISSLVLIAICTYQIILSFNIKTPYVPNIYKEAAKFVTQHPKGTTTLVSAYYDGNFIFHVREYDINKRMIILRADKILVSIAVFKKWGVYSYVYDENDIYKILQDYGIGYIVVEDRDLIGIKAFKMLRKTLNSKKFTLVKCLKPQKNTLEYNYIPKIKNISLLIYEYNNITPPRANDLVIKFPHMGREIRIPFKVIVDSKKYLIN